MKSSAPLLAAAIGFVSGLRSMTAPAAIALAASSGKLPIRGNPLRRLGIKRIATSLAIAAAGEFIADKLPFMPARTKAPSLAFRALSGALAGAAIGIAVSENVTLSGALGASGAVAGSFAGYYGRAAVSRSLGRDLPVALGEDLLAAGLATFVLRAV